MCYVLVTPAKNEELYIQKTLDSVVAQEIRPRRWVIVSDGSTDRTDMIVSRYAKQHAFIRLVRRESGTHDFRSKVLAFEAGCKELEGVSYEFIGNLDADIELPPDYYSLLLQRFAGDGKLGLAGGTRRDRCGESFVRVRFSEFSIGGAYQLFRRSCYEDIGGYQALEFGGEDMVAGIMARHLGWTVRGFADLEVLHHRPTGIAQGNVARCGFRNGLKNHAIGYHPLFESLKLLRAWRPVEVLHNLSEFAGFTFAAMRGKGFCVPGPVVKSLRAEQLKRLRAVTLRYRAPGVGTSDSSQVTRRSVNS